MSSDCNNNKGQQPKEKEEEFAEQHKQYYPRYSPDVNWDELIDDCLGIKKRKIKRRKDTSHKFLSNIIAS